DADGRPTRSTAPAEHDKAHDRHVLEPCERAAAMRARRSGPDNRHRSRQPVDADVQEAADDGAQRGREPDPDPQRKGLDHDGGRASITRGSSGNGHNGDDSERRTRPAGDKSYGVPAGSTGTPGSAPARATAAHSVAR